MSFTIQSEYRNFEIQEYELGIIYLILRFMDLDFFDLKKLNDQNSKIYSYYKVSG